MVRWSSAITEVIACPLASSIAGSTALTVTAVHECSRLGWLGTEPRSKKTKITHCASLAEVGQPWLIEGTGLRIRAPHF